jgi:hypothetical protein
MVGKAKERVEPVNHALTALHRRSAREFAARSKEPRRQAATTICPILRWIRTDAARQLELSQRRAFIARNHLRGTRKPELEFARAKTFLAELCPTASLDPHPAGAWAALFVEVRMAREEGKIVVPSEPHGFFMKALKRATEVSIR